MIRDAIDVYLSCIDNKRVSLLLQLWLISLLTGFAYVAAAAGGHEPWGPLTILVVWFALFVTLEGLAALITAFISLRTMEEEPDWLDRQLAQLSEPQPAHRLGGVEREPASWTMLPDDEGTAHE